MVALQVGGWVVTGRDAPGAPGRRRRTGRPRRWPRGRPGTGPGRRPGGLPGCITHPAAARDPDAVDEDVIGLRRDRACPSPDPTTAPTAAAVAWPAGQSAGRHRRRRRRALAAPATAPAGAERRYRIAPCIRSSISGGMSSSRSISSAARLSVARACALLGVGQRQRAQRQDLVDLGRVEQVARALGRHLRVVVQDDRRGQHQVAAVGRAGQHRPGAGVLAGRDLGGRPLRRVGHGQERPARHADQRVRGDQRVAAGRRRGCAAGRRGRCRSRPGPAAAAPGTGPATRSARSLIDPVQRGPPPDQPAGQPRPRRR